MVAQAGAARCNRFLEYLRDRGGQRLQSRLRNRAAGARRVDAGAEQSLADIDIAQAGNKTLVEQQRLGGRQPVGKGPRQQRRAEIRPQRLRPDAGEQRVRIGTRRVDEIERSEAPRIVERHHPAIAGFENDMVVLANRVRIDPHPPRHAEVQHHRIAAISIDQPIFGAPPAGDDGRPRQSLAQPIGERPAQIGTVPRPPVKALSEPAGSEATHDGFDFGKFGHGCAFMAVPAPAPARPRVQYSASGWPGGGSGRKRETAT